ncbi:LysR family transcriptional regulator [Aquicoccus sp. SCR17]|nr:LysR family transcriptional regulator [Carideicomes alvinocaridis]
MDNPLPHLDWSLMRAFLAVAETGSLSAAARALGTSQPTLGRQVREVEARLGTALFRRHARGLEPTETGAALIGPAERMREAMRDVALTAAGAETRLEGTVRITASVMVSHFILPRVLAAIREAEPAISIDLLPSDRSENLLYREADIAIRMYRPTQLDVVTAKLGEVPMGIFAARSYLARRGRPQDAEQLLEHDLVGLDRDDLLIRGMRDLGWPAERDWFALRCDEQAVTWQLVRAGCGIGFTQREIGQADPLVEQLLPGIALPRLPVWLAAPDAMRRTPRIRRVWELLETGLAPWLAGAS